MQLVIAKIFSKGVGREGFEVARGKAAEELGGRRDCPTTGHLFWTGRMRVEFACIDKWLVINVAEW